MEVKGSVVVDSTKNKKDMLLECVGTHDNTTAKSTAVLTFLYFRHQIVILSFRIYRDEVATKNTTSSSCRTPLDFIQLQCVTVVFKFHKASRTHCVKGEVWKLINCQIHTWTAAADTRQRRQRSLQKLMSERYTQICPLCWTHNHTMNMHNWPSTEPHFSFIIPLAVKSHSRYTDTEQTDLLFL